MGKKLFSYYDNAQSTHAQNLTLQQLLDKMGEELRTKVDNTETVKDHDARQKLKLDTLPAVAWMEQFADGAPHQAGTGKATGVVLTDHDGCNPDEVWQKVSEKMLSHWNDMDQIILGVHRTPSGEGIRILSVGWRGASRFLSVRQRWRSGSDWKMMIARATAAA